MILDAKQNQMGKMHGRDQGTEKKSFLDASRKDQQLFSTRQWILDSPFHFRHTHLATTNDTNTTSFQQRKRATKPHAQDVEKARDTKP
jgi:hypothetical protein